MAIPFQTATFNALRGLQTNKAKTQKQMYDAEVALNGYFDEKGSFIERRGGEIYNRLGAQSDGMCEYFDVGGTQEIVQAAGGNIYIDQSAVPVATGYTAGARYDFDDFEVNIPIFTQDQSFCFGVNGVDDPFAYDGSGFTNVGIIAPTTAPTLTGANGGNLVKTGIYIVAVTYVNQYGVESNPSPFATITLAGNQQTIDLTAIPVSPDTQVTSRNIYMTSESGATLLFNQSIGDNTTTTASITDESTGHLLEFNHDPAPLLSYIEQWKDRLVGAHENIFYVTLRYRPFYWPQGEQSSFDLRFFVPETITGIKAFFDVILIFTERNIYTFGGDRVETFYLEKVKADELIGTVSNWSIKNHENWAYYLSRDGFYRTNGVQVQKVSDPLNDYFNLFSDAELFQVNKANMQNASAVVDFENNLYICSLPTESETIPNTCFVMGFDDIIMSDDNNISPNWSVWEGFTTTVFQEVILNGRTTYLKGDENGDIYNMNQLKGDGAELTSDVTSATATTITDTLQAWTVDAYENMRVEIIEGLGKGEKSVITSNTADTLTFGAFATVPDDTSVYSVGAIDWRYQHAWNSYADPSITKRLRFVRPRFEFETIATIEMYNYFGFTEADIDVIEISLSAYLWDVALWDASLWEGVEVIDDLYSVPGSRPHRWHSIEFRHKRSGQTVTYNGLDKVFKHRGLRR